MWQKMDAARNFCDGEHCFCDMKDHYFLADSVQSQYLFKYYTPQYC